MAVDDAHVAQIDDVVARLRARGMTVDQVMRSVGMVSGSIDDPSALDGVAGVQVHGAVRHQLPDPGSDVQ